MKRLLIALSLFLSAEMAIAAPPANRAGVASPLDLDVLTTIDVNNIEMFVTNQGNFARDNAHGGNSGLFYPKGTTKTAVYAAGLWVGAMIDNTDLAVTVAEFDYEYTPGNYIHLLDASQQDQTRIDDPTAKVYKINKGDTTSDDYLNWPFADGAPYVDENGNGKYDAGEPPRVFGDQTLFSIYHDGYEPAKTNDAGGRPALGLEVQHTTFAFNQSGPLGNVIFFMLKVVNKGGHTLNDTYMSVWSDIDLGGASDDLVGCDVDLSLGYCYNANNNDNQYGATPPAVGFDFFQGPLVPSPGDVAVLPDGREFEDMKILGMSSFNKYANGEDPDSKQGSYWYMQGIYGRGSNAGTPIIDPTTGTATKFMVSGDPVAGTGWLDSNPADRRLMMSTGPFTMEPWTDTNGDGEPDLGEPGVQEIVAATIIGQGGDRLSSISVLKYYDQFAQDAFNQAFNVPSPPPIPVVDVVEGDGEVILTWGDESEVSHNGYDFEGYVVYQLPTIGAPRSQWKKLATFDVVNDVADIIQPVFNIEINKPVDQLMQAGTNSSIKRYIRITEDKVRGMPLYNGTTYYYAVTAYNFNSEAATVKTLESAEQNPLIAAIPQKPIAGDQYPTTHGDMLQTTYVGPAGRVTDGSVSASVINPKALTGNDYEIGFTEVEDADICGTDEEGHALTCLAWTVTNKTTGEVKVSPQPQTATLDPSDQPIFDGLQVKVAGPPPGMKEWSIPAGTRRFTFAGGADALHLEGFEGAMGAGIFGFGAFGVASGTPTTTLKTVLLKLAKVPDGNVYFDPVFDPNDENMSYGYRFGRAFAAAATMPEFDAHMVNRLGGWRYQDYTKSVPLSAWDMDANPPRRLAVGYLENNAVRVADGTGAPVTPGGGLVDGKYWPGPHTAFDNVAAGGPREWLWIFDADYSDATPSTALTQNADGTPLNALTTPLPVMYFVAATRRGEAPFSPNQSGEDQFLITPNYVFAPTDKFTFKSTAPKLNDAAQGKEDLKNIKVVPNPYFAKSSYELDQFNRDLRFNGMPSEFTLRIFNLAGDLVRTLTQDDKTDAANSFVSWDLRNSSDIPVASGMYIWHIESPYGSTFGKFAVFVEEERLRTY